MLDALVDQEQLEQILQQQQAEVQSRLDLMNEKMENWVVQCFSDLRTRIIDLVRPLTSLLGCASAVPPSHGGPLSKLLGCASAMPALLGRPLSKLLGHHHHMIGCYSFIVVIAVSPSLLQYLEPPPVVMQGYTSGQLNGV